MKMTEKTKKMLAIGCGAVICIGLVAAISMQFGNPPAGEDTLPRESSTANEAVIAPSRNIEETEQSDKEESLVIQPDTERAGSTEPSQPVDSRPAQTDQTEQAIQPEVTKPEEPEQAARTDPAQKPDGTKVETPPEPVAHEEVVKPQETEAAAGQPQGGETRNGQVYLPGFGWVPITGTTEIFAEDMYENGNKIGDMGN